MSNIVSIFAALYIGITFGIFFRVSAALKEIKRTLSPSLISPFFSIYFLIWCIRASKSCKIDKGAPLLVFQHLNDVMFIFVVMCTKMSEMNRKYHKELDKCNCNIYSDIQGSYS